MLKSVTINYDFLVERMVDPLFVVYGKGQLSRLVDPLLIVCGKGQLSDFPAAPNLIVDLVSEVS
jgi:hypothetical protein